MSRAGDYNPTAQHQRLAQLYRESAAVIRAHARRLLRAGGYPDRDIAIRFEAGNHFAALAAYHDGLACP